MNSLRVGSIKREHGVIRITRYDATGAVVEVKEQTARQADNFRRSLKAVEKMSKEQQQELLAQLTGAL